MTFFDNFVTVCYFITETDMIYQNLIANFKSLTYGVKMVLNENSASQNKLCNALIYYN